MIDLRELLDDVTTSGLFPQVPMSHVVPDELFYTVGVFGTIISTTGIVCNGLSLLVFARRKSDSAVPVFFMALASFDLLYVITCLVFESLPVIRLRAGGTSKLGTVDRVFHGVNSLAATGSIFTSTALTIDRSIAVEKPFRWSVICSRHRAIVTVLVILLVATLVNLPYILESFILDTGDRPTYLMLMDWHQNSTDARREEQVTHKVFPVTLNTTLLCQSAEREEDEGFTTSELAVTSYEEECDTPDDESPHRVNQLYQTLYVWILLPVFKLAIPVVIIVVTTVRFVYKLRSNKVGIASHITTNTTNTIKTTATLHEKSAKPVKSYTRIALHVTIMAAITVLAHGMLTTSYFVMSQSGTIYVNYCSNSCMSYIGFSHVMVALSSSVKLILISVFNKTFRDEIKSIFACRGCLVGTWKKGRNSSLSVTKNSKRWVIKNGGL